ncbi:hypothetical protein [Streptomyces sp. NBC_01235]|uniref:hypothetical protein n=1 Tax=Streptomyces sp. NBC_01235 TaxID=2903788 RepID=UPI002E0F3B44|nr:hypothetical protein OG289_00470 [Streptomyces sp. NBC_01235]
MLTQQNGVLLPAWIEDAAEANLPGLTGFAHGLTSDLNAVKAAIRMGRIRTTQQGQPASVTAGDDSRRSPPVPPDEVFSGCGHGSMRVPERCLRQLRDVPLNGHVEWSRVAIASNEKLLRMPSSG